MSKVLASSNMSDTAVAGLTTNPLALRIINSDADWNLITDTPDRKVYSSGKGPVGFQDTIILHVTEVKNIYQNVLNFQTAFKSPYQKGLNIMWQYNGFFPETDSVDTAHIAYVPYTLRTVMRVPLHPGMTAANALKLVQTVACLPYAKGIAATSGQVIIDLLNGTRKF